MCSRLVLLILLIGHAASWACNFGPIEVPEFVPVEEDNLCPPQQIVDLVEPIIKQQLAGISYDRMVAWEQLLQWREALGPGFTLKEAFFSWQPRLSAEALGGGACVPITLDMLERLPSDLVAYPVAAHLPKRFEQYGFPTYSHTAVLIPFVDATLHGYILIDTSFDLAEAIVLYEGADLVPVDAHKNGTWWFQIRGNEIYCCSNPGQPRDGIEMTYRTDRFCNPIKASALPMMLVDRRLALVTREENGRQKARIKIELDRDRVIWDTPEGRRPPIALEANWLGSSLLDPEFEDLLGYAPGKLHQRIAFMCQHREEIRELYREYCDYLESQGG